MHVDYVSNKQNKFLIKCEEGKGLFMWWWRGNLVFLWSMKHVLPTVNNYSIELIEWAVFCFVGIVL